MELWKPSATVAAIVVRDGRFLMVRETTADGERLNQPAGHLDPGESLVQAVERETLEETGWHVQARALVGIHLSRYRRAASGTDVTYLRFAFHCELVRHEPGRALDDGILEALWLTQAQVRARSAEHRSPQVLATIEAYLAGDRAPLSMLHTDPACLAP